MVLDLYDDGRSDFNQPLVSRNHSAPCCPDAEEKGRMESDRKEGGGKSQTTRVKRICNRRKFAQSGYDIAKTPYARVTQTVRVKALDGTPPGT